MKIEVNIDGDDFCEQLIANTLRERIKEFEEYAEDYEDNCFSGIPLFDTDPDKDLKEIRKYIKAFKRTLSWFSVPGEDDE